MGSWESAVVGALFLIGCSSGPEPSDVVPPTPEECGIGVGEVQPPSGAEGVFYRSEIRVEFAGFELATSDVDVSLLRFDVQGVGQPVEFTYAVADGDTLTVTPAEYLRPDSLYELSVRYCDGRDGLSSLFRTSTAGGPVNLELLPLETYALRMGEGSWRNLPWQSQMEELDLRLILQRVAAPTPTWDAAWSHPVSANQNVCLPTWRLVTGDFENPWFEVHSDERPVTWEGVDGFGDVTIGAAFAPDLTLDGAQIELHVPVPSCTDWRTLPCRSCRHRESSDDCVVVTATAVPVDPSPVLIRRTQAEIDADPRCD